MKGELALTLASWGGQRPSLADCVTGSRPGTGNRRRIALMLTILFLPNGPAARYLSGLTRASQPPKCGFIVMTRSCFSS